MVLGGVSQKQTLRGACVYKRSPRGDWEGGSATCGPLERRAFSHSAGFTESLEYTQQCVKCWGPSAEWDLGERQLGGELSGEAE